MFTKKKNPPRFIKDRDGNILIFYGRDNGILVYSKLLGKKHIFENNIYRYVIVQNTPPKKIAIKKHK